MYRTTDKETRLFVLKIVVIGLMMFMSFLAGLFVDILFWIVSAVAGGMIAWEYISFAKESGGKDN